MKSKKIDKLRYADYEGTKVCLDIFQFLESLGIKSATDPAQESYEGIDEFCPECHIIHDDCDCRGQHDFDHDAADRAYDAWKDAQLENGD